MTGRRCHQKIRYSSIVGALAVCENLARRHMAGNRPYKCDRCDAWHLTTLVHRVEAELKQARAESILRPGFTMTDETLTLWGLDERPAVISHRRAA